MKLRPEGAAGDMDSFEECQAFNEIVILHTHFIVYFVHTHTNIHTEVVNLNGESLPFSNKGFSLLPLHPSFPYSFWPVWVYNCC